MFQLVKETTRNAIIWALRKAYKFIYYIFDSTWYGIACTLGVPYHRQTEDPYADYRVPSIPIRPAGYYRVLSMTGGDYGSIGDARDTDLNEGVDPNPSGVMHNSGYPDTSVLDNPGHHINGMFNNPEHHFIRMMNIPEHQITQIVENSEGNISPNLGPVHQVLQEPVRYRPNRDVVVQVEDY